MTKLSEIKLGILGGGQLGKMLCLEASNWNVYTTVLDPAEDCPSAAVCSNFVRGEFTSYEDVYNFAQHVDVLTIEIEHVNTDALKDLEREGVDIKPGVDILRTIQDKGEQKKFYKSRNIPTSNFFMFEDESGIREAVNKGELNVPFVQKSRTLGYDGKGVKVVKSPEDIAYLLDGPSIVEDYVNVQKELSVIAARTRGGDVKCFPSVEMVFNPEANLVEYLISPSDLSPEKLKQAEELAVETIKAYGLYGILAVEMFLDENDDLLVNEVAPRPHNSGHHTIESCITSQYEQYLRALLELPLAEPGLLLPSVMVNLLGEPGYEGVAKYEGLSECLAVNGAKIHIYGKKQTRPYRKMGHVTILDNDRNNALQKAKFIREKLKVRS